MSVLLNDVVPGTVFPLESFTVNDTELGTTGLRERDRRVGRDRIARRTRDRRRRLVTDGGGPGGCVVSKMTSTA